MNTKSIASWILSTSTVFETGNKNISFLSLFEFLQAREIFSSILFIFGINSFFIENIAKSPIKINDTITIVVATGLRNSRGEPSCTRHGHRESAAARQRRVHRRGHRDEGLPCSVPNIRYSSSGKSFVAMTAAMDSRWTSGSRFTRAVPRAWRLASGIW